MKTITHNGKPCVEAMVHRLPTESSKILMLTNGNILTYHKEQESDGAVTPIHLYITTDEEIKEGDWYIWKIDGGMVIYQCKLTDKEDLLRLNTVYKNKAKKIIATTDPNLFINIRSHLTSSEGLMVNIPQIPQTFIEEYCKAVGIDKVLVEVEIYDDPNFVEDLNKEMRLTPKILNRPKLNPDNTIIIHPVEEKVIPVSEVERLLKDLYYTGMVDIMNNKCSIDTWIKEKL